MEIESHSFSIEMISKDHVKRISVSSEQKNEVVFEGELTGLVGVKLIEGIMLEISGDNGIIRIDLTEKELSNAFSKKS